ncbi:MAG: PilZ domain-containing protein, partial [Spirochaetaceae bacterium]|nr:PilZ domain-containing protein [Spirochaetaceae bacterium]
SLQLDMLVRLRARASAYFQGLARAKAELEGLKESIGGNAADVGELKARALASKGELSALAEEARFAAKEAKAGGEVVAATSQAAAELERGLASLTATARRESEEAGRIAASLKAIADIVERTHLLATNASIEAARAGARGSGFAVIAQEVRRLAASSRSALADIDAVLASVKKGIDDSSGLVDAVSGSAARLRAALSRSLAAFGAIGERVIGMEAGLAGFDGAFADQIGVAESAASAAEAAAAKVAGFAESYRSRESEYAAIAEAADESERCATEAKRSAGVLAQLAGYLKVGGTERNRVLRKYRVDREAGLRKFGRRDRRETLLYNLEVYDRDGGRLGHLGDLSSSGLLLLTDRQIPVGESRDIAVALPLSTEGERRIPLRIVVRRSESDCDGHRIGCSLEGRNQGDAARVRELLQTLSLGALSAPGLDPDSAVQSACADDGRSAGAAGSDEVLELEEL